MNMKNKKGFTLIELLAVIVVLAIIMVIATMQVNKTIKKARQDSFELALKSLKKQVEQKMATGEEYLCYDSENYAKKQTTYNKEGDMQDLFGNNYFAICGSGGNRPTISLSYKSVTGKDNPYEPGEPLWLTGSLTDFGVNACQDIYDISNDYRMWVAYQFGGGKISVRLQPAGESKFKGAGSIQTYIKTDINPNVTTTSFLNENLEVRYDDNNKKLASISIKQPAGAKCEYNKTHNRFSVTNGWNFESYQCNYQWPNSVISKIEEELASKTTNGKITMKDACEVLTDQSNFPANMEIKK